MTTTETTLEAKIQEMEVKIPGVARFIQQHTRTWRVGPNVFEAWPTDIAYAETEKYKVAAAKWEDKRYELKGSGGIEWNGYVEIYAQLKGSEGEGTLLIDNPWPITTRDMYDPQKDRRELWGYTFVRIQPLEGNKVRVAWADKDGREGPAYEVEKFGSHNIRSL